MPNQLYSLDQILLSQIEEAILYESPLFQLQR